MMLLCLHVLVLLLLQTAHSSLPTTPSHGGPNALALGEPCGVYTLSCAHGLRCTPPKEEQRPLRALLEGRGVCRNASSSSSSSNSTTQVYVADTAPTVDPNEAPCRKLLTTRVSGFKTHLFKSDHIYIPNCDRNGFFSKKQCWSSQDRQRGKCWCVDKNGMPVSENNKLSC